jgi:hypothetical protein
MPVKRFRQFDGKGLGICDGLVVGFAHWLYLLAISMGKTHLPPRRSSTRAKRGEASASLEELIKQQGVKPAKNLDEIGALWPAGDDPKAFLSFVTAERNVRRKKARKRVE